MVEGHSRIQGRKETQEYAFEILKRCKAISICGLALLLQERGELFQRGRSQGQVELAKGIELYFIVYGDIFRDSQLIIDVEVRLVDHLSQEMLLQRNGCVKESPLGKLVEEVFYAE